MSQEERRQVDYRQYLDATLARLARPGLLLAARGPDGRPANAMTIGWATFGIIWGRPMCVVLVRPSRYTYGLIEECRDYTVNVPADGMDDAVAFLGSASGRDMDKLARVGLTAIPSRGVSSPTLAECPVAYECRVVHYNDVIPPNLASEVQRGSYPRGDYHRVYFGEIVAVTVSAGAERI